MKFISNVLAAVFTMAALNAQPAPSVSAPVVAPVAQPSPVDPARLTAAQGLMKAMRFGETMNKVIDVQSAQLTRTVENVLMFMPKGNASPDEIRDLKDRMLQTWKDSVHPDEMLSQMTRAYANIFTVAQLDAMAAFYRSEAGQALVDHTTDLSQQSQLILQAHLQAGIPKIKKMQEDFVAAHPAKPAAAAPSAAASPVAPSASPAK